MATLDLAGIITRVCTDLKEKFASKSVETSKQDKLVSGMNIKTINGTSLLNSGNITVATSDQVGYELRAANAQMRASDRCGLRRIFFTSADGTKMVPINTSTSSSSTDAKTLNTRPIDPFGRIVYCLNPAYVDSTLSPNAHWDQYPLTIGYSYVVTLTPYNPVYLKCTPQSDGSAVMADVVQALPTTNDGYIYIFLGVAYSTSGMELLAHHPVYYHDGTCIRLWTGAESGGGPLIVRGVSDQDGNGRTLDKTWDEIRAAVTSTGVEFIKDNSDGTIVDITRMTFQYILYDTKYSATTPYLVVVSDEEYVTSSASGYPHVSYE